jgi:hypothetical protein
MKLDRGGRLRRPHHAVHSLLTRNSCQLSSSRRFLFFGADQSPTSFRLRPGPGIPPPDPGGSGPHPACHRGETPPSPVMGLQLRERQPSGGRGGILRLVPCLPCPARQRTPPFEARLRRSLRVKGSRTSCVPSVVPVPSLRKYTGTFRASVSLFRFSACHRMQGTRAGPRGPAGPDRCRRDFS